MISELELADELGLSRHTLSFCARTRGIPRNLLKMPGVRLPLIMYQEEDAERIRRIYSYRRAIAVA